MSGAWAGAPVQAIGYLFGSICTDGCCFLLVVQLAGDAAVGTGGKLHFLPVTWVSGGGAEHVFPQTAEETCETTQAPVAPLLGPQAEFSSC